MRRLDLPKWDISRKFRQTKTSCKNKKNYQIVLVKKTADNF